MSKLRQQEKENDAKAAHRTNYEHEEVQKILEEQSEKSKMSLIDQAYQEIEDFEKRLELRKIQEQSIGNGTFGLAAAPQNVIPGKQSRPAAPVQVSGAAGITMPQNLTQVANRLNFTQ